MEIDHIKNEYFCPVTAKSEMVLIRHTKAKLASRTGGGWDYPAISINLGECTGLDSCGVRTDHGRDSSLDLERCPLIAILKTK
jgi:hypothetical protein